MTRLESLLSITTEQESTEGSSSQLTYEIEETTEDKYVSSQTPPSDRSSLRRDRTSQAKHLSRVAAEYNQLLYHVNKARTEKCVFVDQIQWVCGWKPASFRC